MASYLGLMTQSDNGREPADPHSGDLLTAELFADHLYEVALRYAPIPVAPGAGS